MKSKGKQVPKIVWYIYLLCILFLFLWISVLGRNSARNAYLLRKKVENMEADARHLKAVNDSLAQDNMRLKTDPDAAEKAAREQFGLIKPDEKVFRFVPAKESE
ncbi:MAG: septum formation initiator family protein [Candidatus Cloacimonadaceae bacterium]|jgi:cell division protein FtsB|nr:septum formation initiator family protein [Candidatus Cloacimonadota bacterium]MDY0128211.1 septum formation initiator family protein [Candidatus Cloacimonadaceae bacterium]MCB5254294.1 septum formation initiator family protein [Candidatus Cloacimonadota bacterium]MCK9178550.1 septum formation initiator family protein [Candidatus Cloacimonadota bacterium]MCK9242758.1 septum formation initiator family protein [Candidatus Cloacimonadota bacterium]